MTEAEMNHIRRLDQNEALGAAFRAIQAEDAALFDRKQRDYGPGNIGDSWQAFGIASLLVRMNDKMQRLLNLQKTGAKPENESVIDSLADIANYATIARLCIAGEWPMGNDPEGDWSKEAKGIEAILFKPDHAASVREYMPDLYVERAEVNARHPRIEPAMVPFHELNP